MRCPRLHAALLCSAVLHGAALSVPHQVPVAAPTLPRLEARLRPPPPAPVPAPQTTPPPEKAPPPQPPRPAKPAHPPTSRPAKAKPAPVHFQAPPATFHGYPVLAGAAARQALGQLARQPLYPPEAIANGLQGEVLLLLLLDGSGNVLAARVERSSGHALLDQAAASAARQLKALPDGTPREAVLPVRFRLD